MRRYLADWIVDMDDMGETTADRSSHTTLEAAQAAALAGSKRTEACEWARVREQVWVGDKRLGHWETVATWTGDYDHWEQQ